MERGRGGVSCLSCDFFCSLLSMNFRVLTICFAFSLFFGFCVFAITLQFPEKVSEICLSSVTVRLFKLPDLEDQSEDYRLAARYLGTISSSPNLRPAEVISYFSLPPLLILAERYIYRLNIFFPQLITVHHIMRRGLVLPPYLQTIYSLLLKFETVLLHQFFLAAS